MTVEQQTVEAQVYGELAAQARKHFGESALSAIVKVADYDPEREAHNFDNTFFEARPNLLTPLLMTTLATAVSGKNPMAVNRRIVGPFLSQIENITERLETGKVMFMTGHQTMFEPGFVTLAVERAVSRQTGLPYAEIVKRTHLMATRALATVDIVSPRWSLTGVARQLMNVYYSFPATQNYRGSSGIPLDFQRHNNASMLAEFTANTAKPGTIGVLAVSGTTEKFDKDRGAFVVPRIQGDEYHGTMSVLLQDWDIVPVGGSFKRDLVAEPGQLIPAAEVTPDVLHAAMEDVIVASRNRHGIKTVYV